tara:strand:- start:277 stop:1149 length:873 start_codon:yes stop_codon:yes gene_type:complete
MQMKTILKEWRKRLNEVVVDHPIEETYEKITDWATRINRTAEELNIKTPAGVKPEEVVIAMFSDLQPKVSQVDKEGAVTKITFDGVSVDVLAPYFDADWQSEEEVSTAEGSLISLSSFNPVGGKAIIRISGNLKDRKGNALLATVDPTTGKDELRAPLNEQKGEDSPLLKIIREQVKKALREQAEEPRWKVFLDEVKETAAKLKYKLDDRTAIKLAKHASAKDYTLPKTRKMAAAYIQQQKKRADRSKGKGSGPAPQKDEEWGAGDPCIQACKGETNLDTCIKGCRKANR